MLNITDIVLASGNPGKLRELTAILDDLPLRIRAQSEFDVADAVEDGCSFIENALIKARHAATQTGLPALADDSGLCVDALSGAPGIYSARYAGGGASDSENLDKLLAAAADIEDSKRGCQFVCVAAFLRHPRDPIPIVTQGVWNGRLLRDPRGDNGFGYDPIFWVADEEKSSAELSSSRKNVISHRAQALVAMVDRLRC